MKKTAKKATKKKVAKKKPVLKTVKRAPAIKGVVLETKHGFTVLDKVRLSPTTELHECERNPRNVEGIVVGFGLDTRVELKEFDIQVVWPHFMTANNYRPEDLVKA